MGSIAPLPALSSSSLYLLKSRIRPPGVSGSTGSQGFWKSLNAAVPHKGFSPARRSGFFQHFSRACTEALGGIPMKSFAQRLSTTLLFLARMVAKAKVTVSIGGSNASYNGETRHIRLPSLPDDDVVARDLAIGLVLHESGHAAYSEMELYGSLPVKSYLRALFNAIDDVQQERQVIRDWPGAGPALKATVAQMCTSGFFSEVDPTKPASVVQSYVLMHLRHVFLGQPCGHLAAHSREAFTALFGAEKEAEFRDMLETDMSSVWSSQAALDLAKKVIAFFSDDQDDSDQCDSGDPGKGDDTDSGQDDAGDSGKGDDTDSGQDDAGNSGHSGKGDDTDSGQD
ncbi:MAG: hypothetical protein EOM22_12980, partial [Gammaproteobacteria bacterium]|nr:hypothetical protein [Gammaproteobacteria bacterium]